MATTKQIEYLNLLSQQHPVTAGKHLKGRNPVSLGNGESSRMLTQIKTEVKKATGHHAGTQRAIISEALTQRGGDAEGTIIDLLPHVGDVASWPGLTFSRNSGGNRVPLPLPEQHERFRKLVQQMAADGDFGSGGDGRKREKKSELTIYEEWRDFTREVRKFCADRAADGHPLDEIGLRPLEYGLRMLQAGIPMGACKDAMTMHYPPEARRALKVERYDVKSFRRKDRREGIHAALPYVLALIQAKVPVALVGPKGTGKTTLAGQIAEFLNLPFGFVSMTSGTSPSAFNGRPKIGGDGGVVESVWTSVFGGGGVFLMDEMDAADENLLLKVNAALANGYFANDATGEIVERHEDFIPMCGMNTLGLGAGRDYNSRNKLDAATLDRWNMGRVRIDLDPRIEDSLVESILAEEAAKKKENPKAETAKA